MKISGINRPRGNIVPSRWASLGAMLKVAFVSSLTMAFPSMAVAQEKTIEAAESEGTVVPAREAEITPIVSAWLREIAFAPGQMVEEGEVLFEFARPPAEYRLQLAQAQLDDARVQLLEAIQT